MESVLPPYTVPIVQSGLASVLFEKKPCESTGIRCVKTSPVQMVSRIERGWAGRGARHCRYLVGVHMAWT